MILDIGLYQFWSAQPGIAAIVSDRIYPVLIEQHAKGETQKIPCIEYRRVAGGRQPLFCGTDKTARATLLVASYAKDIVSAKLLAEEVRLATIDYVGMMGAVKVKGCFLDNDADSLDPEPGRYRATQTWGIWYVET